METINAHRERPVCDCGQPAQIEVRLITSDEFTCAACVRKRQAMPSYRELADRGTMFDSRTRTEHAAA